jgi:hypothetical protein
VVGSAVALEAVGRLYWLVAEIEVASEISGYR